jgi:hypothetical protein
MLGNGLRVVMAWAGEAFVISRGVAQRLEINPATGLTVVTYRTGVPMSSGLTVEVRAEDPNDANYARITIALAELGFDYKGPSSPHWRLDHVRHMSAGGFATDAALTLVSRVVPINPRSEPADFVWWHD